LQAASSFGEAIFAVGGLKRFFGNKRTAEYFRLNTASWHDMPEMEAEVNGS
jgi:hypothetical protein